MVLRGCNSSESVGTTSSSRKGNDYKQITDEHIGLHVFNDPKSDPPSDDIHVDIIAVHGLGAHPHNTWTTAREAEGKTEWISWLTEKDMLPAVIPNARIWRFGYESQWFGRDAIKTTASNIAVALLSELEQKQLGSERPIVFIAHSFGGLVVLQTICHTRSQQSHNNKWFEKFGGLIFFGTPFRGAQGMKTDDMRPAALSVYEFQDVEFQMLEDMQSSSETLTKLVDDFCKTWPWHQKYPIMCYYELKASEVGKVVGKERRRILVVDERAGCLDLFHGVEKRGLVKHHFNINKFASPEAMEFRHVSKKIADICEIAVNRFRNDKIEHMTDGNGDITHDLRAEGRPAAFGRVSASSEAKVDKVCSVVYPSFVQLPMGRFVRGKGKPELEKDILDPLTPIPKESIDVSIYSKYEHEEPEEPSFFVALLCSLMSRATYRRSKTNVHITTEQVTRHQLKDPEGWFKQLTQPESVREWLQESEDAGCDVYIVTGFNMMKDPTIIEYSNGAATSSKQVSMVEASTETIDQQKGRVNSCLKRKGHYICAVQYRQVHFSERSSKTMDKTSMAGGVFWERRWDMRGDNEEEEDEEEDNVILVELQNKLEMSEHYEVLSFRDDEIFLY